MNELRCFGCMKLKTGRPECEHCGYDERKRNAPHQLQHGTLLQNQYYVGRVLGQGGFGITYMGWDSFLEIPIAIKEYYPNVVVTRNTTISPAVYLRDEEGKDQYTNNLKRFAKEARSLARLDAEEQITNIVRVHNLVQANNTAYIIMEYVAGVDLREHIRRKGRPLTAQETLELLLPLMKALDKIHNRGIIHRDISPDNIMVMLDGSAKLIDFGASHLAQSDDYGNQKSTEAIVKHGFAPMEQYSRKGHLGPWTDVYAMCATVYYCLTRTVLPPVMDRAFYDEEIDWAIVKGLSQGQLQAMKDGLALNTASRIQSMAVLHARLTAVEEPEQSVAPAREAAEEPEAEIALPQEPVQEAEASLQPAEEPQIPQQPEEAAQEAAISATEPVVQEIYTEPIQGVELSAFLASEVPEGEESLIAATVPVEEEILLPEEPAAEEMAQWEEDSISATEPVQEDEYSALLTPEEAVISATEPVVEALPVIAEVTEETKAEALETAPEDELPEIQEEPEEAQPVIPEEEKYDAEPVIPELEEEETFEVQEEVSEEETEPELPEEEIASEPETPETEEEEIPEVPEEVLEEETKPVIPEEEECTAEAEIPEQVEEEIPEVPEEVLEEESKPVILEEEEYTSESEIPQPTEEEISESLEEAPAEEREPAIAGESAITPQAPRQEPVAAAAVAAQVPEEPKAPAKAKGAKRKSKGKIWAAMAAVLVCVIGLAMGWLLMQGGGTAPVITPAADLSPDSWKDNVLANPYAGKDFKTWNDYKSQPIFGSEISNGRIRSVTFLDTLEAEPRGSWDVSAARNRSVKAWVVENGELYDLYIAAEGGINGGTACPNLFTSFTQLQEVAFNGAFHTEEAVDMSSMFANCTKLTELDLGSFDTGKVTDMRSMFASCESLTRLDLSSFRTGEVTNMAHMFSECKGLEELNLSGLNTARVTTMRNMFSGCERLTSLDLGSFDTAAVTGMSSLFAGCSRLTELDISSFDTSNVTEMDMMFSGCKKLAALDVTGFDTAKVVSMTAMFRDCRKLSTLDVSSFNTANVNTMEQMFAGCKKLTALDLRNFDTANVSSMVEMFQNCWDLIDLDVSSFDTTKALRSDMFAGCKDLQQVDLSGFTYDDNFSGGWIFDGCASLLNVNHPSYNEFVPFSRTMANAWRNNVLMPTYGGRENSVQNWNDLKGMTVFGGKIRNDQIRSVTFKDAGGYGVPANSWDVSAGRNGSIGAYVVYNGDLYDLYIVAEGGINLKNCKMMFANFTNLEEINFNGMVHTEDATDMMAMFYNCRKLKKLDLSDFETGKVTNMHSMFMDCESLVELDISGFDTSRVNDMGQMFMMSDLCYSKLDELDLDSFDTSAVNHMHDMFRGLKALKKLDLGSFDTGRVQDMDRMFFKCESLQQLNVSSFDTRRVRNMEDMFCGCKQLSALDLGSFETFGVTDMSGMFHGCESLASLDVAGFNTANVTDMSSMFRGCGSLAALELPGFNTASVRTMPYMFEGCESLTALDLSAFRPTGRPTTLDMFKGCSLAGVNHPELNKLLPGYEPWMGNVLMNTHDGLDNGTWHMERAWMWTEVYRSEIASCQVRSVTFLDTLAEEPEDSWDVSAAKDDSVKCWARENGELYDLYIAAEGGINASQACKKMFIRFTELEEVNFGKAFHTQGTRNMESMFAGCSKLTKLDVSGFDTSCVTDLRWMFAGCRALSELNLGSFVIAEGADAKEILDRCTALTDVNHPDFNQLLGG